MRTRWLPVLLLLVFLTGCGSLKATAEVSAEGRFRFDAELSLLINEGEVAQYYPEGVACQDLADSWAGDSDIVATVVERIDGPRLTCRLTGDVPIATLNDMDRNGGMLVTDTGDEFIVFWTKAQWFSFDEVEVRLTFPGPISAHNGTSAVEGTTVVWREASDLTSEDGLRATGGKYPVLPGWIIPAGVGLLMVVGGCGLWWIRRQLPRVTEDVGSDGPVEGAWPEPDPIEAEPPAAAISAIVAPNATPQLSPLLPGAGKGASHPDRLRSATVPEPHPEPDWVWAPPDDRHSGGPA